MTEEKKIEALIFDMGHVFVDFEWEQVCLGFCQTFGISLDEFKPILKHISTLGYETGHIDTVGLLKEVEKVTRISLEEDRFHTLWNATFRENELVSNILHHLKGNYPLYLLSNTNESHWNFLEETFQVIRHFDDLVLSFEIGYAKPQVEIYKEVLRRAKKEPEQCLFIDDLEANVKAAQSIGIQTIHFQSGQDLLDNLTRRGILSP